MSVINSQPLIGASGQAGYNLTKSLRFRSSATAYLSRTPASASNRSTWTWSGWVKRGVLGATQNTLFASTTGVTDATYFQMAFSTVNSDCLLINSYNITSLGMQTAAVFRDPAAWYHIVFALDTTQATASNRMKLYVNGVQQTSFLTYINYPALNSTFAINSAAAHNIGASNATSPFDGYMAEVNFIDGQALTPSSFGETSTTTGVWIPKKYTGTYGTNGFYLPFTDTTSTSTLGTDFSGNSNTWTVNNISLTSGSTYDSMTDVPTLTSATTANYCTWNPVGIYVTTPLDGNLKISGTSAGANGTIGASSGKFYWECVYTAIGSAEGVLVGIRSTDSIATGAAENVGYYGGGSENGKKTVNGVASAYAATWTTNDVIGVAVDLDGGTVTFYKNNVSQGAISFTVGGKTWTSFNWRTGAAGTNTGTINFGQQPFTYTPPTGFVALNTFNLPTPTIGATASSQAGKYFNPVLYTGTDGVAGSVTGVGFQPDFVWGKRRSVNASHTLYDAVRGATKEIYSDLTNAEGTNSNGLTAFNSDGFSYGVSSALSQGSIVAWCWKANGAGSTNTAGSITSTVSANTTAGFSIVTYTGTGSNATVGHGLGVAPSMVIVKNRTTGGTSWNVYHISTGNTGAIFLESTAAFSADSTRWNNTTPTSSVFSVGSGAGVNQNTNNLVAYCFAPVAGYSAFGSYTGNSSTDGPFVYLGFRPRFVMFKNINDGTTAWIILDTARNTYNIMGERLDPNASDAGSTFNTVDYLSNGFKLRANNGINQSGETMIYMAFAENPFKYANSR